MPDTRDEIFGYGGGGVPRGRCEAVLRVTGATEPAERFPRFRRRLARRLPTINQVSRQQVELLRRFRAAADEEERQQYSRRCCCRSTASRAGFGATG